MCSCWGAAACCCWFCVTATGLAATEAVKLFKSAACWLAAADCNILRLVMPFGGECWGTPVVRGRRERWEA